MIKKIATGFLAAVMIAGTVTTSVSAAQASGTGTSGSTSEINYSEMTFDEIYATKIDEDYEPVINYLTKQYLYPEEKLTDMIREVSRMFEEDSSEMLHTWRKKWKARNYTE